MDLDVFVIGGGGTGSEVAFGLHEADPALRIAIAERDRFGGECNLSACVPTKAMVRSASVAAHARDAARFGVQIPQVDIDFPAIMRRVRSVVDAQSSAQERPFLDAGIQVVHEDVRFIGPHELEAADGRRFTAESIVIATGSEPVEPPIPGLAGTPYWTNTEAIWSPDEVPASLAIIGGGAIGAEFAQIYARFGSRVTIVEVAPHILPQEDADAAAALHRTLEDEGIRILTETKTEAVSHGADGWDIPLSDGSRIRTQELLVATGRRARLGGLDLDKARIRLDEDGAPLLDDALRTTTQWIWVGGDATGDMLFTHVGSYEARLIVRSILGRRGAKDYRVIPRVTFTDPEVASVGITEEQAREAGHELRVGLAGENERAAIDGEPSPFVKIVTDAATGQILGGHIVSSQAGSMIHEIAAAMAGRVTVAELREAVHAYPTLSESVNGAVRECC